MAGRKGEAEGGVRPRTMDPVFQSPVSQTKGKGPNRDPQGFPMEAPSIGHGHKNERKNDDGRGASQGGDAPHSKDDSGIAVFPSPIINHLIPMKEKRGVEEK